MNKNETLILKAIDYTEKGVAVCKHEGFVVFVPNLLIDESAEVLIVKVLKTHAFGRVTKLIETSAHRVSPKCPIATVCGGCQLQHMSYDHQLYFKKNHVQNLLTRSLQDESLKVDSIVAMDEPEYYRNKAIVPFNPETMDYGFYRAHSHDIVPFESCMIQNEESNQILFLIQSFYKNHNIVFENLRHVLIKKGFESNQIMVVLVLSKKKVPLSEELVDALIEEFPNIISIQTNLNKRTDNVLLTDNYSLLYGRTVIEDTLDGIVFEISAASFYQVNPVQAVKLYKIALDFAKLTDKNTLLDLYCGIGTISLFAARKAKHVIGVEVVQAAIDDAKRNAELNKIENVEFICGDVKEVLADLQSKKTKVNVVLVDPPRKGLSEEAIGSILALKAKKVVYISCDPGTLSRDLKSLSASYIIEKIQCVDMFPQTYHVETVVLLEKKKVTAE